MIVVDASVLGSALVDDEPPGDRARARLTGEQLAAPEVIDLEIASACRRLVLAGELATLRASLALDDLAAIPLQRKRHRPLVARVWELRANLTPYDAAYVALAEDLGALLLTADGPLSRAPGPRCRTELLT